MASKINNDLEFQLSKSLFLSNEWGVEYITIEMDQGMEMEGKFKKIEWKGKTPYAISKTDGNQIQLYTIHFRSKDAIKNFFTCTSPSFVALNLYFKFIYLLQRIRRNIKKILSRQKQNN